MFTLLSLHGIAPSILAASLFDVSSSSLPEKSSELQIKTSFGDFAQVSHARSLVSVSSPSSSSFRKIHNHRDRQYFAGGHVVQYTTARSTIRPLANRTGDDIFCNDVDVGDANWLKDHHLLHVAIPFKVVTCCNSIQSSNLLQFHSK